MNHGNFYRQTRIQKKLNETNSRYIRLFVCLLELKTANELTDFSNIYIFFTLNTYVLLIRVVSGISMLLARKKQI